MICMLISCLSGRGKKCDERQKKKKDSKTKTKVYNQSP